MKRLVTPQEAGEYIGRHRKTVIGLIHAGELPAVNGGNLSNMRGARYGISVADLDRWLESRRVAA